MSPTMSISLVVVSLSVNSAVALLARYLVTCIRVNHGKCVVRQARCALVVHVPSIDADSGADACGTQV